jgi:uncharacterized protein (TIGR03084 family)
VAEFMDVFTNLRVESEQLSEFLTGLADGQWDRPTPAPGWTVKHQLAHLIATFRIAGLAATDSAAFTAMMGKMSNDFNANVAAAMTPHLGQSPAALLELWTSISTSTTDNLERVAMGQVVPWLVRPIPGPVLAAAGLTEIFAHSQDIYDAVDFSVDRTDRIRSVCEFGVRVWDFGYLARKLSVPDISFGYELVAPSGTCWHWGATDTKERIIGSGVDFCLLITRRRHRLDLDLRATGPEGNRWLDIAQAYRGPAGPGRAPGQFS